MMEKVKITLLWLVIMVAGVGCKKAADNNPTPEKPKTGSCTIEFQTVAGTQNLVLGQKYFNALGEPFRVNEFKYYVSNIELLKPDGSIQTVPNSYFLIHEGETNSITLKEVPAGTYSGLKFLIGVDSTKSVSGAKTGDLDPVKGMYWEWTSDYIFLIMNGTSDSSKASGKNILYHIAGYKGPYKALQSISNNFNGATIDIRPDATPSIHFLVDILELFKSPEDISIAKVSVIHAPGPDAVKIANNYKDMFKFYHVHN